MKISGYGLELSKLVQQQRAVPKPLGGAERPGAAQKSSGAPGSSFAELLERVATSDRQADASAAQYAAGGTQDLHGTMVAVAKADLNLALLVNVRNKIIEAYREVMRMS